MLRGILYAVAFGLLTTPVAHATTWYVPDDFSTIQGAMGSSAVVDGDTVIVRPGTYVENIDFLGKAITLVSEQGADVTSIDGNQTGSVVTFVSGETETSVLKGFTITNGKSNRGGGIFIASSSPKIVSNIVMANLAVDLPGEETDSMGGGIYCEDASVWIDRNRIERNSTITDTWYRNAWGGGICSVNSSARITRNTIHENSVMVNDAYECAGGGIAVMGGGVEIAGNRISENVVNGWLAYPSALGGGVYCSQTTPTIISNVICGNTVEATGALAGMGGGIIILEGFEGAIVNNVIADNFVQDAWFGEGGGVALYSVPETLFSGNSVAYNVVEEWMGQGGAGLLVSDSATLTIANSIFWGNRMDGEGLGTMWQIDTKGTVLDASYCDIQPGAGWTGPGPGIIHVDPGFVSVPSGDYHLRIGSPCVDSGSNDAAELPGPDCEGDERIVDGNLDGLAVVDMGADELLPEIAALFGTVNSAGEGLANVLRINGTVGNRKRRYITPPGASLSVAMEVAPSGPNPAPFVLYVWSGEPEVATLTPHPRNVGTMSFPTPLSGGSPQPMKIWNNIGKTQYLGEPSFPSNPAPSTPLNLPTGIGFPITLTFQGFIMDNGSAADKPASITNGMVLKVVE